MKRLLIPILLALLLVLMGGSYFILRLDNVNNLIASILKLAMIFMGPLSIYLLWIRPRSLPKLLAYLSFILCLGAAHFIIPSTYKGFFNQTLIWLLPVLEVSIIILVVYSTTKSIIRYRAIRSNKPHHFLEVIRISLEPKLGSGFILEAVLTELSVLYYSIFVWFNKPNLENGTYTYHKKSQIKTIVILFSILIAVEGAFFHYLIQTWRVTFAWIFTILNLYALFYMVGLYNSVKFLPHVINQNKLIIRLGYQSSIELDIENIESIKHAREIEFGAKAPKDTYISLLKTDTPQYELFLKESIPMKGSYGKRRYVNSVVFRADEPNKLMEDIQSKR